MGNFTSGSATIHACPPHRVRTVMDILERYGLVDYDEQPDRLTLALGEPYSAEGTFSFGDATALANMLIEAAPDVAFTAHEEPLGEPGTTCSYVPGLGLFAAPCDNYGEALFGQSDVLQWLDEPADVRDAKLGVPWRTAIAAMPDGTVEEPESSVAHWVPHHCELTVHSKSEGPLRLTVWPADGQTTPDFAAADKSLKELGFERFRDWTALDETSQLWRTDVYESRSQ
ncbi:hypothetical protein C8D87_11479 [Lentzea atacamensis]|uniref:Uncharacterized protein n=1 Tax=Lentzea atacamensis TaxID=531938 RepID=A0ABX9DWJ3_9PSEU|nr:hypothetical protein [Lentzea atacamensis]RAS59467.1 hypothetical protein C8D87_11479 [Lentzea atacamensis]